MRLRILNPFVTGDWRSYATGDVVDVEDIEAAAYVANGQAEEIPPDSGAAPATPAATKPTGKGRK